MHYPSFAKARVIRKKRSHKSKGYGFVSFTHPTCFAQAFKEMNGIYCGCKQFLYIYYIKGRYVGNRPVKLRRSNWKDRQLAK